MATKKLIAPKRELSSDDAPRYVSDYLQTKDTFKQLDERLKSMKATLKVFITQYGTKDDKGNTWVRLPGMPDLKIEVRRTNTFDEAKATAWLKKNKLYESCLVTETFLDEDLALAAAFDNKAPDSVTKGWYTTSETEALKP